jgi:hydrogenase expression/formation protein HypC
MCVGIPMQVVETLGATARCRYQGAVRLIDMSLVGHQPAGTWVMTFLDAAREVIDAETAMQSLAALEAVALAMRGEADIDHLFADLVGREPQLPDFLRETATDTAAKEQR